MATDRRTVKAADVVRDIQAGMSDPDLMEKYELTEKQLEFLFEQLLSRGLITERQLSERASLADTAITKAFVEVQQSITELDEENDTRKGWEIQSLIQALHEAQTLGVSTKDTKKDKGKQIRASDVVNDIRTGLTDSQLMEKYEIVPKQLELIYQKLVESGRVKVEELYNRASLSGTSITNAFVQVYEALRELD